MFVDKIKTLNNKILPKIFYNSFAGFLKLLQVFKSTSFIVIILYKKGKVKNCHTEYREDTVLVSFQVFFQLCFVINKILNGTKLLYMIDFSYLSKCSYYKYKKCSNFRVF